jgi:hypothetical protein
MSTASATEALPYLTRAELDAAKAAGYRYRVTNAPARLGLTPRTTSVERLFEALPADGSVSAAWTGFGHLSGVEHFSRHLMRRSADGTRVEVMECERGTIVLAYPLGAGRTVRTLVQAAR